MSKISVILELLADGEWHQIDELGEIAGLNDIQSQGVLAFLHEYNIAEMQVDERRLKITESFRELLSDP